MILKIRSYFEKLDKLQIKNVISKIRNDLKKNVFFLKNGIIMKNKCNFENCVSIENFE
jgi:hypothetical protein